MNLNNYVKLFYMHMRASVFAGLLDLQCLSEVYLKPNPNYFPQLNHLLQIVGVNVCWLGLRVMSCGRDPFWSNQYDSATSKTTFQQSLSERSRGLCLLQTKVVRPIISGDLNMWYFESLCLDSLTVQRLFMTPVICTDLFTLMSFNMIMSFFFQLKRN